MNQNHSEIVYRFFDPDDTLHLNHYMRFGLSEYDFYQGLCKSIKYHGLEAAQDAANPGNGFTLQLFAAEDGPITPCILIRVIFDNPASHVRWFLEMRRLKRFYQFINNHLYNPNTPIISLSHYLLITLLDGPAHPCSQTMTFAFTPLMLPFAQGFVHCEQENWLPQNFFAATQVPINSKQAKMLGFSIASDFYRHLSTCPSLGTLLTILTNLASSCFLCWAFLYHKNKSVSKRFVTSAFKCDTFTAVFGNNELYKTKPNPRKKYSRRYYNKLKHAYTPTDTYKESYKLKENDPPIIKSESFIELNDDSLCDLWVKKYHRYNFPLMYEACRIYQFGR